jgi:hypothetical protein
MIDVTQGLVEKDCVARIAKDDVRPGATAGIGSPRLRTSQSPDISPFGEELLSDRGPQEAPSDDQDARGDRFRSCHRREYSPGHGDAPLAAWTYAVVRGERAFTSYVKC